ncbi:MAG: hydroxymethylbilane synthase [Acidobacteria bacterium]|nr:hydroxymethylbilane synthase [Acidobacteriota bacterium]MDA1236440.1 hydroxymethylbilane synthase [Acidobacteriota bacterium]
MIELVIGSRGSKLALWQARYIAAQLDALGVKTRIEVIKTTGDKITDVALARVGEVSGLKGVFTKEIEEALLDGSIDLAVHSLKDLPTELPEGLTIGVVPVREDPRDALVGKTLDELKSGDRIGTGSLRRAAQIRRLKPGVETVDIRGNVDTRLRKLDEGQYDAIILACSGLKRLGLQDRIAQALDPELMAPAIGQGALGIEVRIGDGVTLEAVAPLNHIPTHLAVEAERALLEAFGGGCQIPLGGHARVDGDDLVLSAAVFSHDGATLIRGQDTGPMTEAKELGRRLAASLKAKGADKLLPS